MRYWNKTTALSCLMGALFAMPPVLRAEPLKIACPLKEILFVAEVASTPEQHQTGLMYRTSLEPQAGMLFLFPHHKTFAPTMWMKNTSIPLDMLFADEEGVVLHVFENTTPFSIAPIGPVPGTAQIFEVNAGMAQKHGIKPGCVLKRFKKKKK